MGLPSPPLLTIPVLRVKVLGLRFAQAPPRLASPSAHLAGAVLPGIAVSLVYNYLFFLSDRRVPEISASSISGCVRYRVRPKPFGNN